MVVWSYPFSLDVLDISNNEWYQETQGEPEQIKGEK